MQLFFPLFTLCFPSTTTNTIIESIIFPTHPPQSNPLLGDPVIIRGPFLESRDNQRARQAVPVYIKDPGLDSSASNMIKLSVNEAKWSSLLARTRTLILYISI